LISESREAARARKRKDDAAAPPSEWKREFGKKCKLSPDGKSFELKVTEDSDIRKAYEMQAGTRAVEIERGAEMQARMRREKVVRKDGRVVDFPEELVDTAKDKLRPAGRSGGAPTERFGLSDAFRKYERGPDGLWFVDNGGWEPTDLWRNGALSPQRDPDGNRWVEQDGEWSLMDEVG